MKDDNEIFEYISDDEDDEPDDATMLMEEDEDNEEYDEEDDEEIALRTTVMAKNDLVALIGLKTSPRGGIIVRVDPRQERPAAQVYETPEAAAKWFNRSLATSKRNGWNVIYDGTPAFG